MLTLKQQIEQDEQNTTVIQNRYLYSVLKGKNTISGIITSNNYSEVLAQFEEVLKENQISTKRLRNYSITRQDAEITRFEKTLIAV